MRKININRMIETSYEDGSCWIEYIIEKNKIGYIHYYTENEDMKDLLEHYYNTNEKLNEMLTDKPSISVCSNYLRELIEECMESENEMWFVEEEDIDNESLEKVKQEVDNLKLSEYITFNEDAAITIYGEVITKFLF